MSPDEPMLNEAVVADPGAPNEAAAAEVPAAEAVSQEVVAGAAPPVPVADVVPAPEGSPPMEAEAAPTGTAVEQTASQRRGVPRPVRAIGHGIAAVAPSVIGIGLLVAGLVGGWAIATSRQPIPVSTPSTASVGALAPAQEPPVVVSEVISAIGADDGNLLAASLPQGPLTQIQNALQGVAHVRRVIPTGTVAAGDQTVTAIQIVAEDTSGQLFGIDLLIHTDSTGVVGFR